MKFCTFLQYLTFFQFLSIATAKLKNQPTVTIHKLRLVIIAYKDCTNPPKPKQKQNAKAAEKASAY